MIGSGEPGLAYLGVDDARKAIEFYGERSGSIRDPFGHRWNIGHHIEDVTPDEMQRRYTEMMKGS